MHFRLMARRKYRSIPFSHAGRQLEARAVPAAGSWEIWIYENNRALTRYTFIDMQTVKDAEHYHMDLLVDEMTGAAKYLRDSEDPVKVEPTTKLIDRHIEDQTSQGVQSRSCR